MVLRLKIVISFLFLLFTTIAFGENPPIKEKIDAIISEYTTQINNLLSKQTSIIKLGEDYFVQIKSSVLDNVDHTNDLQSFNLAENKNSEIRLTDYITLLASDYRGLLKGEFIDKSIIIDECPVSMEGKDVYLVTIKKELYFQNQTKVFDFLIGVNLNSEYPISFAFFNEVARSEKNIPVNVACLTDKQEEEIRDIRKRQFITLKNQADQYYIKEDYYNARESYKKALILNPENQDVIDGIDNSNFFIIERRKEIIQTLINQEQYQNALLEINKVKPEDQTDEWYSEKIEICKTNLSAKQDKNELNRADVLFENHQAKKALSIYQSLSSSKHLDQTYITNQIIKCKESDPYFIQSALKKAYNEAVKSKKNYLSTFQTYSKYQSSGLLSGEQYYFMCLMMINKHSAVAKPMGYTKNQAKLLSRVYFYKAKDLGINVSFLETQIFTKNIEKRKN